MTSMEHIKKTLKLIYRYFKMIKTNKLNNLLWYYQDYKKLKQQKGNDITFRFGNIYPILTDKYQDGGTMSGHYFHQDLYVAGLIYRNNPKKHLDIGSRTDGFVAHVASFRNIEIIDIRNIKSKVKNINFKQADLMKLPTDMVDSYDSISSLHAIEHFGLGRYNDPIDYFGHLKAIDNITKILQKGGVFYFSVPIGPQRIEFNAHRVFSLEYLIKHLSKNYTIQTFSYIDDNGDFFEDVELNEITIKSNFNCTYGCGIFVLTKN
jgi:SAM-dependent methyltransferase